MFSSQMDPSKADRSSDLMDVRTTLAELTARARRLIKEGDDNRVSLNSKGVYEVAKRTADVIQEKTEGTRGVSSSSGSTQASVELFMSRNFAFDLQEQQHLISQLQQKQTEAALNVTSTDFSGNHRDPTWGEDATGDIDAVIARIKSDSLRQAHQAVYQKEREDLEQRTHQMLKAAWKSYYMSVSDDFDGLSASMEHTLHHHDGQVIPQHHQGFVSELRTSNFMAFIGADAPFSHEMNAKIGAFASIVDQYPPSQWIYHFTSYMVETKSCAGADMSILWATVQAILKPIIREGSSATALSYAAASRAVLESKYRNRLITASTRVDTSRVEELENLPAERMSEIIQASVGGNPWSHVYSSMKCGRYDVAVLACRRIGAAALEEGLRRYAQASSLERQALSPVTALRMMYSEEATKEDPFRRAVLFALLAGRTGEAESDVEADLVSIASKVSSSLEDMLWLRLFSIRTLEETPSGGKVQSLAYMHNSILDDMQDLMQVVQGSLPRLASFLFHAMLPAMGLRLLLENVSTYVDGVHMALCFNTVHLLNENALESPVDLERHISRYVAMILCSDNSAVQARQQAGAAVFSYFQKSGFTQAFVDLCQKDIICGRLFGLRSTRENNGGLLLQPSTMDKSDLWKTMQQIAETAASRNCFPMALHILCALAQTVSRASGPRAVIGAAFSRAVQIACPALSQVFYLPMESGDAAAVIAESKHLLELLHAAATDVMTGVDDTTLRILCTMSDVFLAFGKQQWEVVLGTLFTLPFVPSSPAADMEACVRAYCSASPHVITASGAILPLAFKAAAHLLDSYRQLTSTTSDQREESLTKASALCQHLQVVAFWMRRIASQSGQPFSELPNEVRDFEQRFL